MTADRRFERDLTAVLEDLYLGPSPDYRREVLAVATHRRQRPAWAFPGRWLPMADIASTVHMRAPVRWPVVGIALLVLALILATLVAYVGSHRTRPGPAFGQAGNGQIAFARDGDLFTIDPVSGVSTPLITGPAAEDQPAFSPDGTHLAFRRVNTSTASPAEDLVVANADGSSPMVITSEPIAGGASGIEWTPDSRSLLVGVPIEDELRLYDATEATPPRVIARSAGFGTSPFQPPDGTALMIIRAAGADADWSVLDLATGTETRLAPHFADGGNPRWSPDGSTVVYTQPDPGHPDAPVLWVVDADGTNAHRITAEPGIWAEYDPAWSPDGTRIAFNRAVREEGEAFSPMRTGILTLATGRIDEVGPTAADVRAANPGPLDALASEVEAYMFDWSPDGRWLLAMGQDAVAHPILIDTTTGDHRVLDVLVAPGTASQMWQRTALDP